MPGFDDSVFEKPLDAETPSVKSKGFRAWLTQKKEDIKCVFQSGMRK